MSNTMKKFAGVAGSLLLAYLLVFAQCVWAGQDPKAKDNPNGARKAAAQQTGEKQSPVRAAKAQSNQPQGEESESSMAAKKLPNDGSHQGIKVHGSWTIEVRNPDGTRVSRVEFENSLVGPQILTNLLLGSSVPGGFRVHLDDGTGNVGINGPCPATSNGITDCELEGSLTSPTPVGFGDSTTGYPSQANGFPLTIAANAIGTSVVLSGTAKAGSSGQIVNLFTAVLTCPYAGPSIGPASVSPAACSTGLTSSGNAFTHFTLPTALPIAAGQLIAVTVTISFS